MRAVLLSLLILTGCDPVVTGSGRHATETRELQSPFDAVHVHRGLKVRLDVGRAGAVRLSGDDNLLPEVSTEVVDGRLHVDLREGTGSLEPVLPLTIDVSTPSLLQAAASGGAILAVTDVDAARFVASVTGVSRLALSGRTEELEVGLAGGARLLARSLVADRVRLAAGAHDEAEVTALDLLEVEVTGGAVVVYYGEPRVEGNADGGIVRPAE